MSIGGLVIASSSTVLVSALGKSAATCSVGRKVSSHERKGLTISV